jgi:hypothetical protein
LVWTYTPIISWGYLLGLFEGVFASLGQAWGFYFEKGVALKAQVHQNLGMSLGAVWGISLGFKIRLDLGRGT